MLSPHYFKKIICKKTSEYFHAKMQQRFREASAALASYNLMVSPVYLEYLRGERELDCAVWGSPLYGPQGWSGPCYLLNRKAYDNAGDWRGGISGQPRYAATGGARRKRARAGAADEHQPRDQ